MDIEVKHIQTYYSAQMPCLGKTVEDAKVKNVVTINRGQNVIYVDVEGEPQAAFFSLDLDEEFINQVRSAKYSPTTSLGFPVWQKQFGYVPGAIDTEADTRGELRVEEELKASLYKYAKEIEDKFYAPNFVKNYAFHKESVEVIPERLRMNGSVFTNGVINSGCALKHHFDKGAFEDPINKLSCCTCCLFLEKDTTGGELHIPALNIAYKPRGFSLGIFKGAEQIHGVSRIDIPKSGYRYSIVYYTLESNAGV